jgi:uncharacterized repeat protein (TIGR01451 family)
MTTSRSWTAWCTLLACLTAAALLGDAGRASAQGYHFTVIADTAPGSQFLHLGTPTLNAYGTVAFEAELRAGGAGVYRATGGLLDRIYEDPSGTFVFPGALNAAIDDADRVVFQLGDVLMAGDGGALTIFADSSLPVSYGPDTFPCTLHLPGRTISGAGVMPLICDVETAPEEGGFVLALSAGGGLTRICDDSGQFAFCGYLGAAISPDGTTLVANDGARLGRGAPGLQAVIDPASFGASAVLVDLHEAILGVSNTGVLAFDAFVIETSGVAGHRVFTLDAGGQLVQVTPLVARSATSGFLEAREHSISGSGALIFAALRKQGLGMVAGLYRGPDPLADKLLEQGDALPGYGSLAARFFLAHPAINDAGQFAFLAELGDRTQVIVRADPPRLDRPPVIANPGAQTTPIAGQVQLPVGATDPDGDALVFGASGLPDGLGIDRFSGVISGAPNGPRGDYAVEVSVSDGQISDRAQFTWTVLERVPDARSGLTATVAPGDYIVTLSWTNPAPDVAHHILIEASFDGGQTYLEIDTVPGTATTYVLSGTPGFLECFRVSAVNIDRLLSAPSNSVCVTPNPILEIANLRSETALNSATLAWGTNLAATGSLKYRLPGGPWIGPVTPVSDAAGTSHRVQLRPLRPRTTYLFEVAMCALPAGTPNCNQASGSFTTSGPSLDASPNGDFRVVGPGAEALKTRIEATLTIRNPQRQDTRVDHVAIDPGTTLDVPCPPQSGQCNATFNTYRLRSATPASLGTLEPGQSQSVVVAFDVDDFVLGGLAGVFNRSSRINLIVDFDYANDVGTVASSSTIEVRLSLPARTADLSITMEGPAVLPPSPSQTFRYVITVHNGGPDPATGMRVVDTLPPGVEFIGFTGVFWRCNTRRGGQEVVCASTSPLPEGSSDFLELEVELVGISATAIVNSATVIGNESDPTADNSATVMTSLGTGPSTDLEVVSVNYDGLVPRRTEVTFAITVRNNGPNPVNDVDVTGPFGDEFVGWNSPVGCIDVGFAICRLAHLAVGETITVEEVVFYRGRQTEIGEARVTGPGPDPRPANNAISTRVEVVRGP